ncbi:MAG TPA: helix-turn-helix domain-containing protein, partial [Vicinamibacterales bacterium]|nr:helix-turn-helix domain-containing protein [Vicinamibacterales bacterium]
WRLFHRLHAARGEVVSVVELKSALRRPTDAALTSALQRLRTQLKSVNLASSLQNAHGVGYRWLYVAGFAGLTKGGIVANREG